MGKKSHFTQKQKLDVLQSAKNVGIRKSADLAGVHYSTVYQWQRKLNVLGEEAFLAYWPKSRGRGIKKVTKAQESEALCPGTSCGSVLEAAMNKDLSQEEVGVLIRGKKILRAKGLPMDADVKSICEVAGVSRKTGLPMGWQAGNCV